MTREKKESLLSLACLGFLCLTLLINVSSVDPLLLKKPCTPGKKEAAVGSVLVFEQRTKQRQINAKMNNDSV